LVLADECGLGPDLRAPDLAPDVHPILPRFTFLIRSDRSPPGFDL